MSRSSSALAISLLLVLAAVLIAQVTAQDGAEGDQLYLVAGPTLFRGADFLEPNVYPFWYGEYSYESRTDLVVAVYYFDITLDEAERWASAVCAGRILRTDENRFFYTSGNDWSVVVAIQARFPDESSAAGLYPDPSRAVPDLSSLPCRIVGSFVREHLRFQAVEGPRVDTSVRPPAFPAFVPLD